MCSNSFRDRRTELFKLCLLRTLSTCAPALSETEKLSCDVANQTLEIDNLKELGVNTSKMVDELKEQQGQLQAYTESKSFGLVISVLASLIALISP